MGRSVILREYGDLYKKLFYLGKWVPAGALRIAGRSYDYAKDATPHPVLLSMGEGTQE
jgi:hypothetical protein